jgi:DNA-directed RNA polymerase specialized sigma24 family protein
MASSFLVMVTNPADTLLQEYAQCADPDRAEYLLETLVVEHAQPGIRKIVRYKLAFQGAAEAQDADDVASEVLLELISRLRAMKDASPADAIGDFSGYTAVSAYHACNEYLRRKYPNRHRLKTRLRYLLSTEKGLAIWENDGAEWLCGFGRWQAEQRQAVSGERLTRWREELHDVPRGRAQHPADTVKAVFTRFAGPVAFDELVGIVAQLWGVEDLPPASEKDARELESGESDPGSRMDLRRWMGELWGQIGELPQPQRIALLLNLRAGPDGAAVALLPLTGIAGIRQIAEVLEIPAQEFAALWNRLPLDDLAIAERLGVTRQRVINLRKSARERLTRRMGGKDRLS